MGCTRNLSGFISVDPVTPPLTDDAWSYYLLVMGQPLALCSAPITPSPSVCFYQCICQHKREGREKERGDGRDGEHNISISSSLQNLSRSKKQSRQYAGEAALYCIKDVSRVADTTRWTCDGIILAKSNSTGLFLP